MQARFTTSISSADGWSYAAQQVVTLEGTEFTPTAIPEEMGRVWLEVGHLEPLDVELETATRPRGRRK